jgi:hypothetical protein
MQVFSPQKFGRSNDDPLITVVVPVGPIAHKFANLINWLPECSENFDVVLVVDERGDSTHKMLTDFLHHTPISAEITVLHGEFGGPGAARNEGMRIARGKWLIFWDADDIPNVQTTLNLVLDISEETDVIVGGYCMISETSQTRIETNSLRKLAFNPGLWRIILRRDFIQNQYFPNLLLGEDQVFLSRVFTRPCEVLFSEEIIYSYVTSQSDQLTSGTKNQSDLLVAAELVKNLGCQGILHKIVELRLRATYVKRSLKAGASAFRTIDLKRSLKLFVQINYLLFRGRNE